MRNAYTFTYWGSCNKRGPFQDEAIMQEILGRIAALSICFSPATVKGEANFGAIRSVEFSREGASDTCVSLTAMRILQALAFGG